jgi:hypothetical protein
MEEEMNKWINRIIRSKVMWFNAILAGLTALEAAFTIFQPMLPGNIYAYFSVALAVGNAILRVVTTQPLSDK